MVERLLQFSMQVHTNNGVGMKKLQEHTLYLFGGAIICMFVVSFIGMLYEACSKLTDMFGPWGLILIAAASYAAGWIFIRKMDERVKKNSKPKFIHYKLDDLKKEK